MKKLHHLLKKKVLDEKQIEDICDKILFIFKYKKDIAPKLDKDKLKIKIKENIKYEFKENYLYLINNLFDIKEKDINDVIIELIKKNKKDEYFNSEHYYYLTKENLLKIIEIEKTIKIIMKRIEKFNLNYQAEGEIEKMLGKLDKSKFKLDYILSLLEGFINDIQ